MDQGNPTRSGLNLNWGVQVAAIPCTGLDKALLTVDTGPVYTYTVFMNVTLSIDKHVAERARKAARSLGKSLNQVVREFLEELAGTKSAEEDVEELLRLSAESKGHSRGWAFNREEIHERS
jgi:hypothetical protein